MLMFPTVKQAAEQDSRKAVDRDAAGRVADMSLYRPNMGVALFRSDGRVWLGRRADVWNMDEPPERWLWQMPQGGIDSGEDFETAARRELAEETGVRSVDVLTITPGWLAYDFPRGVNKRGFIGQRQKWAAMLFLGSDDEIDLHTHNPDGPEFDDWRWAELEETLDSVVPFKHQVYQEVIAAFAPLRDFIRGLKR